MKFDYTYKTSDNVRHSGIVEAKSREEAFAVLRARGIRAIRVNLILEPMPLWKKLLVAAGSVCLLVGLAVFLWLFRFTVTGSGPADRAVAPRYAELSANAEKVCAAHREAFGAVDTELLRNYALIERAVDLQRLDDELAKAKIVISNSREQMKSLFCEVPRIFADDPTSLSSAEKLFGEKIAEIDADEARIEADECAIVLLSENRGKWSVGKGAVKFTDKELARDFEFLTRSVDPATARWRKDFTPAVVSSEIIEIRNGKVIRRPEK